MFIFFGASVAGAQTGSLIFSILFLLGAPAVSLPAVLRHEKALWDAVPVPNQAFRPASARTDHRMASWLQDSVPHGAVKAWASSVPTALKYHQRGSRTDRVLG